MHMRTPLGISLITESPEPGSGEGSCQECCSKQSVYTQPAEKEAEANKALEERKKLQEQHKMKIQKQDMLRRPEALACDLCTADIEVILV